MNLFDRVKLLVRSTIGGGFPDIAFTPDENGLKLLDKAQARIEILQADIARAEKRGDEALATRLKREVDALQKTVNRARHQLGQTVPAPVLAQAPAPAPAQTQPATSTPVSQPIVSAKQEAPAVDSVKSEDGNGDGDGAMDDSRVADQIRKAREDKT